MNLRLEIEPIPISTWGISLAHKLPKEEWNKLRKKCYEDAGYRCEICGEGDETLHCHECWTFDDRRRIQHLAAVSCRCTMCHDVNHFGRSKKVYDSVYVERLIQHWCKVNERTPHEFLIYERQVWEISKKRASRNYVVKVGRKVLY